MRDRRQGGREGSGSVLVWGACGSSVAFRSATLLHVYRRDPLYVMEAVSLVRARRSARGSSEEDIS